ncbi:MAG: hypothetical protein K6F61_06500 [Clostridiales bacterium]|nr:hypothetical protein [Clostridiales bacterium]
MCRSFFLFREYGILTFSFYTNTNEGFIKDASIIASSIQPYAPKQEE